MEVEPEVLDQLFLIARWLRLNSGEGRHFLLPADEDPSFLALRLGAWLRGAALELSAASPQQSDTRMLEDEPGAEWADDPETAGGQKSSRR
jgi:hypothetical protein